MNIFEKIKKIFTSNSYGLPFVPVPMESLEFFRKTYFEYTRVPFYIKFRPKMKKWIIGASVFIFCIGLMSEKKIYFIFGFSILLIMLLEFFKSRKKSSSWEIVKIEFKEVLLEKEVLDLSILIKSKLNNFFNTLVVCVTFTGSKQKNYYNFIRTLKPLGTAVVNFKIATDMGMGDFNIESIQVITKDDLGLFPLCIDLRLEKKISVLPEEIPLETFALEQIGRAMHAGIFEKNQKGNSSSLLGLRDFAMGDSIRKIAWKKSQRRGKLTVKDFDQIYSTDVTIFFDQNSRGHSEFQGLSSIEAMRDSTLTIAKSFLSQQMRVQFISESHRLEFASGDFQFMQLREIVPKLKPVATNFNDLILKNFKSIPTDSVVVMLFPTHGINYDVLWEIFFNLHDRRVQTYIIAFDSESYARSVKAAANISSAGWKGFDMISNYINENKNSATNKLFTTLMDRTYIVGVNQTIADAYYEKNTNILHPGL